VSGSRRQHRTGLVGAIATYSILTLTCLFSILPILWAVSTSLKAPADIVRYPPNWIPSPISLEHYAQVLGGSHMPRYFANSLLVALATIALTLVVASHGGYAAARYEFPAKNLLLFLILATVMIPGIAVLVPLYMIMSQVGLHDTYWSLILIYSAWQVPTVLWLMRGFFESIPRSRRSTGSSPPSPGPAWPPRRSWCSCTSGTSSSLP